MHCLGVLHYRSPARRIESRYTGGGESLTVLLSGVYFGSEGGARGFEARAGDVVYWPRGLPRVEHNDPARPMRALVVIFRWPERIDRVPRVVHDRQNVIRTIAQTMLTAQEAPHPHRQAILDGYTSALLAEYLRLSDASSHELVAKVMRYTVEHPRRSFGLDELARHVGLEKHYFGRRYREITGGRTPMQDVRRMRIEHAVGILQSAPDIGLKDVAYRVGMGSSHLLARWLRRELGLTSRELRGKG